MRNLLLACSALAILGPFSAFAAERWEKPEDNRPRIEIVKPGEGEAARKKAVFKGMDTDDDGMVSTEELIRGSKKRFKHKDLDGNGWLSLEEFQGEGLGGEDEDPNVELDANDLKELEGIRARRFERLDRDGNGVLSEDEILADDRERHVWMDMNEDGRVTLEEVDARRRDTEAKAERLLQESGGFLKRKGLE